MRFKLALTVLWSLFMVNLPVGNSIPLSQARDDVAAAYLEEMGWQTSEMLLPYKRMFLHKKVENLLVEKLMMDQSRDRHKLTL